VSRCGSEDEKINKKPKDPSFLSQDRAAFQNASFDLGRNIDNIR
jgi:hypothetical protein